MLQRVSSLEIQRHGLVVAVACVSLFIFISSGARADVRVRQIRILVIGKCVGGRVFRRLVAEELVKGRSKFSFAIMDVPCLSLYSSL
jgi:hypothetical protein